MKKLHLPLFFILFIITILPLCITTINNEKFQYYNKYEYVLVKRYLQTHPEGRVLIPLSFMLIDDIPSERLASFEEFEEFEIIGINEARALHIHYIIWNP